jgi:hypothetical protein
VWKTAEYVEELLKEYPEIDIYMENMFDMTPEVLVGISERLCQYSNYGVCLDYAHASISDSPMRDWVEMLAPYLKHVHISDNDLKSLEIEGYELEPKFDKGTLEYKLTLDQSVEMVKVNAKANDDKASVKGTGEVNLSLGENTIEIKVIAENGNEKVYKLIISVEDLHPIEVEVDKKKYTIVKKNNELIELLENFEEIKLNIEEQEVVGYNNPNTNVNLVILKDEDNKLGYYVYNSHDNSYVRYRYININGINLQLLDSNEKLHNFDKYKVTVQEEEIDIYKIKKSHKVGLIYGTNNANGNTGYYVYDKNEETLSKYFDEEISLYKSENEKLRNVIMLLIGSFSLVVIVYVIILLVRSKKKKRKF